MLSLRSPGSLHWAHHGAHSVGLSASFKHIYGNLFRLPLFPIQVQQTPTHSTTTYLFTHLLVLFHSFHHSEERFLVVKVVRMFHFNCSLSSCVILLLRLRSQIALYLSPVTWTSLQKQFQELLLLSHYITTPTI